MKSTNATSEASLRRRDIATGQMWELLSEDFLSLFLDNGNLRRQLLGHLTSSSINREFGTIVTKGTDRISVLITNPESCTTMYNFIKRHGGFSSIAEKLKSPTQNLKLFNGIIDLFSLHVRVGTVTNYTASEHSKFQEDHVPINGS